MIAGSRCLRGQNQWRWHAERFCHLAALTALAVLTLPPASGQNASASASGALLLCDDRDRQLSIVALVVGDFDRLQKGPVKAGQPSHGCLSYDL